MSANIAGEVRGCTVLLEPMVERQLQRDILEELHRVQLVLQEGQIIFPIESLLKEVWPNNMFTKNAPPHINCKSPLVFNKLNPMGIFPSIIMAIVPIYCGVVLEASLVRPTNLTFKFWSLLNKPVAVRDSIRKIVPMQALVQAQFVGVKVLVLQNCLDGVARDT